jgi:hypothetical protein
MDYKKIIRSRKLRIKFLQIFNFIPDKQMVQLQYRIKTGRKLDLKNPKRFTEKLQWYKLYDRNPLMAQCADKYEVRKYIEKIGLGNILNELYGIYDSPDEIDFAQLPDSFVLKDTLGGGGNAVILVGDKTQMDEAAVRRQMWEWVNTPVRMKHPGREWVYEGRKHRIIAERLLACPNGDLPDYKFFCFDHQVQYFYIRTGYAKNHALGELSFFDRNLKYLQGVGMDYCGISDKRPKLCDEVKKMMEMAENLSAEFPHVRVDLYNIDGQIYFGELTFFNASGYMKFEPDAFDFEMGEKFKLRTCP